LEARTSAFSVQRVFVVISIQLTQTLDAIERPKKKEGKDQLEYIAKVTLLNDTYFARLT